MTTSLDAMLLGTYLAAAGVLIAMTGGRLAIATHLNPLLEGDNFSAEVMEIGFSSPLAAWEDQSHRVNG